MTYAVKNAAVLDAALAGALSGMGISGKAISLTSTSDYAALGAQSVAFAEEFDTQWGVVTASNFELAAITEACEGFWAGRQPATDNSAAQTQGFYTADVPPIIAAILAGVAAKITAGILVQEPIPQINLKGICLSNVASLAAFTVADAGGNHDGTTFVEGDTLLLVGQTTKSQNRPYSVGPVTAGVAALTPYVLGTNQLILQGAEVSLAAGTIFAKTKWFARKNGGGTSIEVGVSSVDWFPRQVEWNETLVAGQITITQVPVSSDRCAVDITRKVADTCDATTGGYHPTVGGSNGITAGLSSDSGGTAEIVVEATILAGTINAADVSDLRILISNF